MSQENEITNASHSGANERGGQGARVPEGANERGGQGARAPGFDVGAPSESLGPFVSVIMPVRNEVGFIERSLRAVVGQDYPVARMEILVADGMSNDGTRALVQALQQEHPQIKLIDNPGMIVATGLNAALLQARGEIIVRVDGHCELAPDYLRCSVSHLVHEGVEAVGGPLETIGQSLKARAVAAAMGSRFGVGGSAFRVAGRSTRFTDTVAFPAYTRAVIDRAGPFDEELVRNQDDEYNYRLRKMGVKILLAADVRSRYYSRATLGKLASQYFQYGYWKVRVLQKHPRQMQPRQFVPALFVVVFLAALVLMLLFPLAQYLSAGLAGLYLIAVILASLLSARKCGWDLLPVLPLTYGTLHLSYGLGFLIGLLKFGRRWGDRETPVENSPSLPDAAAL
jgi:succinoglycan biosynthesis protein ExoA